MSDIAIVERQAGDVTVLELNGKLTINSKAEVDAVRKFRLKIRSLVKERKLNLVLDMQGINYVDAGGIGELVTSYTILKKEKGQLTLCRLSDEVEKLLSLTRLLHIFNVFNSPEEGVASLPNRQAA